jgi:protein-S-isoprenylcysteine O-methyltransferase Ste14
MLRLGDGWLLFRRCWDFLLPYDVFGILDGRDAARLPRSHPQQKLVVVGFYRYVRNPMYVGFAMSWIGLWIVFGHANPAAIAAVAAVALAVHLFVVFYEEPTLRQKFGADYEAYCRNVNRWWPLVRGWDQPGLRTQ